MIIVRNIKVVRKFLILVEKWIVCILSFNVYYYGDYIKLYLVIIFKV